MTSRYAWVLNLDADVELATTISPGASARYSPSARVREAMARHIAPLAQSLLDDDDRLVNEASAPNAARGYVGRAFCPTPRARAILERAGAAPEPAPSVEVLRRVNSRAFASALGATLPEAAFVTDLSAAIAHLGRAPETSERWRVKRAFGMTGRGQRVIAPGTPRDNDVAFVRAGMNEGGVQIEPNVAIERECAMHAVVEVDGRLRTGTLVAQRCDARGAWNATERVDPSDARVLFGALVDDLASEIALVGRALHEASYFGPFGVDAYTFRDRHNRLQIQRRGEINARYSMGFAVGFGRQP